jgi:LEA14-like dessication related protein
MEVAFQVRNTNPDPLYVERFEYELSLNGRKLGRGFYPDALELGAFRDQRVVSRFDINFLRLPGVVQQLLERDKVKAEVEGTFYVRRGSGIQKLRFRNDAEVDLNR